MSYKFEDLPEGGFRVWDDNRCEVIARFNGFAWQFGRGYTSWYGHIPLFGFCQLVRMIAESLMADWQPKPNSKFTYAREWAIEQTAKSISRRVHVYWEREVAKIPEHKRRMLSRVFSTTFQSHPMLFLDELYQHPYIVSDLERYRAARHVIVNLASPSKHYLVMENWRDLLSDTHNTYQALNRTLDALPGNLQTGTVFQLEHVHLERSVSDRLELLTLLKTVGNWQARRHTNVMMFAHHNDILRAMEMVSHYLHRPLSSRRQADISELINFVGTWRETHTGNIVGLTEKALRWHRNEAEERLQRLYRNLNDTTPTAVPPVPIPQIPGITFLDTTGAVRQEGLNMDHCIAGYANDAIDGDCFLFHVEYSGASASAQVDRRGRVVQAYGRRNSINAACTYARRKLNQWGQAFPTSNGEIETAPVEWDNQDMVMGF